MAHETMPGDRVADRARPVGRAVEHGAPRAAPLDGRTAHLAKGQRRDAGTIWRANPREQGLIGLTDAIAWFGASGWSVCVPLIDSQPYDLVVDDGAELARVQVETTTHRRKNGAFEVSICTTGGNQSFHTSKPFEQASCDLLYVLTDSGQRYLIPTGDIRATSKLTLGRRMARHRVEPPTTR